MWSRVSVLNYYVANCDCWTLQSKVQENILNIRENRPSAQAVSRRVTEKTMKYEMKQYDGAGIYCLLQPAFLFSLLCILQPPRIFFVPNQQVAAALPGLLSPEESSVAVTSFYSRKDTNSVTAQAGKWAYLCMEHPAFQMTCPYKCCEHRCQKPL